MKKENLIILDLLKYSIDKKQKNKIKSDIKKNLDWQYIYDISINQGVSPIIYKSIKNLRFNKEIIDAFKEFYDLTYKRNSRLYKELEKILNAFKKENIDVIFLKGIYLSKYVYKDIGLRPMADIDILIKKENLSKINKILKKNNFIREKDSKKAKLHNSYINKQKKIKIEAHYNVNKMNEFFYINPNLFFDQKNTIFFKDIKSYSLNPELELLFMCLHISKHIRQDGAISLKWLVDILFYLNNKKINFERFNNLIKKLKIINQIYFILLIYKKYIDPSFNLQKIIKPSLLNKKLINYTVIKNYFLIFDKNKHKTKDYMNFVLLNNLQKIKMIFNYIFPSIDNLCHNFNIERKTPFDYFFYLLNPFRLLINFFIILFKNNN
jgi:hypothetical protein